MPNLKSFYSKYPVCILSHKPEPACSSFNKLIINDITLFSDSGQTRIFAKLSRSIGTQYKADSTNTQFSQRAADLLAYNSRTPSTSR